MIREDLKKRLRRMEQDTGSEERQVVVFHVPRPPGQSIGVPLGKDTWALVLSGPDLTEDEIAELRKKHCVDEDSEAEEADSDSASETPQ